MRQARNALGGRTVGQTLDCWKERLDYDATKREQLARSSFSDAVDSLRYRHAFASRQVP